MEAFSGSMQTALRQELWTRMRGSAQTDSQKGEEDYAKPEKHSEWSELCRAAVYRYQDANSPVTS